MSRKNKAGHLSNCQITAESSVISTDGSASNLSTQKRKEDAEQIFYIDRI